MQRNIDNTSDVTRNLILLPEKDLQAIRVHRMFRKHIWQNEKLKIKWGNLKMNSNCNSKNYIVVERCWSFKCRGKKCSLSFGNSTRARTPMAMSIIIDCWRTFPILENLFVSKTSKQKLLIKNFSSKNLSSKTSLLTFCCPYGIRVDSQWNNEGQRKVKKMSFCLHRRCKMVEVIKTGWHMETYASEIHVVCGEATKS